MASAICATALVPALAFMRDGMTLGDDIDTTHMLLTYGVSKMEEQLAIVGATWTDGTSAATSPPTATRTSVSASRGPTRRPAAESTTD